MRLLNLGPSIALAAALTALPTLPVRAALTISKNPTQNVSCADGTCVATAADAMLNNRDLERLLRASDLTLVSGNIAMDVVVASKFHWTKPHRLTVDAYRSIAIEAAVVVEGSGAVTLKKNDGGSDGTLTFAGKGHLSFWDLKSSLVIDRSSYGLVGDIKSLSRRIAAHPSRNYALAKFYDASVDGVYSAAPIATPFNGKFDGLGHAIANLAITVPKKSTAGFGLFLSLAAHSVVRNLTLQNFRYGGDKIDSENAGMLAAQSSGRLLNIAIVGGQISAGDGCAGGIVGQNSGTILNAHVDATAILGGASGGIACDNLGSIAHSYSSATVGGGLESWAGGIASENGGTISLCYVTGEVQVDGGDGHLGSNGDEGAGGIAAQNGGAIDRSFSLAAVDGGASSGGETHQSFSFAGGLVAENNGTVTNSYALGSVASWDPFGIGVFVGGVQGDSDEGSGSVSSGYFAGTFDCDSCRDGPGGFAGDGRGDFSAGYWDTDTSGTDTACGWGNQCTGVAGLTDSALKAALPDGFDPKVWALNANINSGYPYLIDNPPPQ